MASIPAIGHTKSVANFGSGIQIIPIIIIRQTSVFGIVQEMAVHCTAHQAAISKF